MEQKTYILLDVGGTEIKVYFDKHQVPMKTAMIADINGISMGYRDALLDNGVEFLFTNIHCHHGMYPLYQNQTPYFWENDLDERRERIPAAQPEV